MGLRTIKNCKALLPLPLIFLLFSRCAPSIRVKGEIKRCEMLFFEGRTNEAALCAISEEKGAFLLSMILAEKGYFPLAHRLLDSTEEGSSSLYHFVKGYIYFKEGKLQEAEREFSRAERMGMDSPDLYLMLFMTNSLLCLHEKARGYFEKLKKYKNFTDAHFTMEPTEGSCSP